MKTLYFPVHPRTRKALEVIGAQFKQNVRLIEPVGYFDMMLLEENARLIVTDSGGVQREAYFLGVPSLTLRDNTEWIETVEVGWNRLVGADTRENPASLERFLASCRASANLRRRQGQRDNLPADRRLGGYFSNFFRTTRPRWDSRCFFGACGASPHKHLKIRVFIPWA